MVKLQWHEVRRLGRSMAHVSAPVPARRGNPGPRPPL